MQRSAIEFHDSTLSSLTWDASDVAVHLSAYVHTSDGIPGRDPVKGWEQDVKFVITMATVSGRVRDRARLSDGQLQINGETIEELLPVPFSAAGGVRLALEAGSERVSISGAEIRVIAVGEPTFVENFPGT